MLTRDRCSSNVLVQALWVYTLPFFMPVIPVGDALYLAVVVFDCS